MKTIIKVRNAVTGLGQDADIHATSHVTLVYDDGEQKEHT